MNTFKASALALFSAAALSGCAANQDTTRFDATPLSLAGSGELSLVQSQAASLNALSRDMIRKSTGRGAAVGAVVGCGLGLVSASSAQKCLAGAAAGALAGAAVGHQAGKRKVERAAQRVNPDQMAVSLRETSAKVGEIKGTLPSLLARQDAELAQLKADKAAGKITDEAYAAGVEAIRQDRAALAEALTQSAQTANRSAQNLGSASAKGQPELMWHINQAIMLEDEATSARAQIKLF